MITLIVLCIVALVGMWLATVAFAYYNKYYNVKYHGPNSNYVKNLVHEHNGKCYHFEPQVYMCPTFSFY